MATVTLRRSGTAEYLRRLGSNWLLLSTRETAPESATETPASKRHPGEGGNEPDTDDRRNGQRSE